MGCSGTMKLNTRMLPVKASYFFTLAAVASLLPFLGIYMKQVGLTPIEAAIIYGLMPFIGGIVRPLIGAVADKLHAHKAALMVCCIVSGIFFGGLLFAPRRLQHMLSATNGQDVDFICDGSTSKLIRHCFAQNSSCQVNLADSASGAAYVLDEGSVLNSTNNCHVICNRSSVLNAAICPGGNRSRCADSGVLEFDIPSFSAIELFEAAPQTCILYRFDDLVVDGGVAVSELDCPESHSEPCSMHCEGGAMDCESDSLAADPTTFDTTFWYCVMFMLVANIAFAPIFSLIDAMTYDFLGEEHGKWGRQRVWGTVGFAIFAVVSGLSMDSFSTGTSSGDKDYTVAFVLYAVLSFLAAVAVWLYKISPEFSSTQMMKDVCQIIRRLRALSLLVLVFIFGMYTGVIETFLYWHLSNLGGSQLLFGLCMLVNCLPEISILFMAGKIIDKIGHVNMLYITLVAYAVRLISYSFLSNPWVVLAIEPLHGITFGLMYAAASSYASIITPPGMHGVMQGLIGGVHFGLGKGFGSVLSGPIFQQYGGVIMFRSYGISAIVTLVLYGLLQIFIIRRLEPIPGAEDAAETKGRGFGGVLSGPIFQKFGGELLFRGYGVSAIVVLILYWLAQVCIINRREPMLEPDTEKEPADLQEKETMLNGAREHKGPDEAETSLKGTKDSSNDQREVLA